MNELNAVRLIESYVIINAVMPINISILLARFDVVSVAVDES